MNGLGVVCVVGAGQIGTSIGMALRGSAAAVADEVLLWDVDPARRARCLVLGGADRGLVDAEEVLAADVIVLAIPVSEVVRWVETWGGQVSPDTLVVDTGSAKQAVVAAMRSHLRAGTHGIGGHPVCGNEGRGPDAGDPEMLKGAVFVLTPLADDATALERARALVDALGSQPVVLDAARHDEILAVSSHLPHLVAAALVELVPDAGPETELWRRLLGPGFSGATRLAASDPDMVASFLAANAGPLRQAVGELQRALREWEAEVASPRSLAARLERASSRRAALLGDC